MNFKPTYLYVKEHTVTGKRYFGKTSSRDPTKYVGSGLYWFLHVKKHGKEHVKTLWYKLFTNQEECTEFAEFFSVEMDIVNSDRWLNMKPENGLDGGSTDEHLKKWRSAGTIASISSPNHASKNPNHEQLEKMRMACAESPSSSRNDPKLLKRWRDAAIASPNHPSKRVMSCSHCGITGTQLSLFRYHFDNCKLREIIL